MVGMASITDVNSLANKLMSIVHGQLHLDKQIHGQEGGVQITARWVGYRAQWGLAAGT